MKKVFLEHDVVKFTIWGPQEVGMTETTGLSASCDTWVNVVVWIGLSETIPFQSNKVDQEAQALQSIGMMASADGTL